MQAPVRLGLASQFLDELRRLRVRAEQLRLAEEAREKRSCTIESACRLAIAELRRARTVGTASAVARLLEQALETK